MHTSSKLEQVAKEPIDRPMSVRFALTNRTPIGVPCHGSPPTSRLEAMIGQFVPSHATISSVTKIVFDKRVREERV